MRLITKLLTILLIKKREKQGGGREEEGGRENAYMYTIKGQIFKEIRDINLHSQKIPKS